MPNTKRCVVLGGSFNPPTLAHKKLLQTAMEHLDARLGLFVPSSGFYVTRKTSRQEHAIPLSEDQRKQLLMCMCGPGMDVDTCEYGDQSKGRTLQTLLDIQKQYPDYEIWFLMGDDKLDIFHKWKTRKDILGQFSLLWTARDSRDAEKLLQNLKTDPLFAGYMATQNVMTAPKDVTGISSSAFWKELKTNGFDKACRLLAPEAMAVMKNILKTEQTEETLC